ncbi:hypothetical protein V8C43DRAFT_296809 [Trichoderma afarasin]
MPVILPMSYIEASCLVSIFGGVLSRLTHACLNRPSICLSLNLVFFSLLLVFFYSVSARVGCVCTGTLPPRDGSKHTCSGGCVPRALGGL